MVDLSRVKKSCAIKKCTDMHHARGWCTKHYQRWLNSGDPEQEPSTPPTRCTIEGCDKEPRARGWCKMHWRRWRNHGDPNYQRPTTCSIEKCERKVFGLGYCKMHHRRLERHGDPNVTALHVGLTREERLWEGVTRGAPDACWPWREAIQQAGYGSLAHNGKTYRAHRFAYEVLVGPIPDGHVIDHQCHKPDSCEGGTSCPHRRCCNPSHMTPVASTFNTTRDRAVSANGRKTHCKRGHAFTPANTKITTGGGRACRRCIAIREDERSKRRRASMT